MLVLRRRKNESILIGDDIRVIVGEIKNNKVKLLVEAPKDIKILREEIK